MNEKHAMDSTSPGQPDLGRAAERRLRNNGDAAFDSMSEADVRAALHELQVLRTELEAQNEDLLRAQTALQKVSDKYRDLFNFAPVGYFRLDEQGRILELNLAGAALLGLDRSTALTQGFGQYVAPHTRGRFAEWLKDALMADRKQTCEIELRRNDGPICVVLEGVAAPNGDGSKSLSVTTTDISARKWAEDTQAFLSLCGEAGPGENFFQRLARYLAETLHIDYVCIDRLVGDRLSAQTVAVYNDGTFDENLTYTLKDTPCGEVVGKTICCFPKDVCQLFPKDEALRLLKAEGYVGATLWSFDGKPIGLIALISRRPLADPQPAESVLKLVAVRAAGELERNQAEESLKQLNDTLEQRVAERSAEARRRAEQLRRMAAELAQAEQRERRRLSQVLHDHLQQLLVAARMKVQRLQRRAGQDEALAQMADEVDDLIDQCISESRSLTVELSPPVLYDGGLAAGLNWLGRRVEEKHGLTVEVVAEPAANPADMDLSVFLFQAVRELLFNVVKHARAAWARVSMLPAKDGELRIEVRDDGEGCDPQRLAGHAGNGGGFGLFSIRERLELLGGQLEIVAESGEGTRVAIVIPPGEWPTAQIGAAPGRRAVAAPSVVSRRPGGLRVLLADDHPVVRKGLADLLREQAGIEVVIEARDGQEAVDLALEARPDVVVMDITMPRMDGIEATRRIKAQLPQVRVIGLSMHEDANMRKAMCAAGAGDYLRKDASSDKLVAAILHPA